MKLLLDTHAWLWMLGAPERFNPEARALVEDEETVLLLSSASSWEIAIKWSLGKLDLPEPPEPFVLSRLDSSAVTPLSIEHSHALQVANLTHHHRDPFDRLLIAQAMVERVPILTADAAFDPYPIEVVPAGSGARSLTDR